MSPRMWIIGKIKSDWICWRRRSFLTAAKKAKHAAQEPGVRTKLFIADETIGLGKINLLALLDEAGSISAAARQSLAARSSRCAAGRRRAFMPHVHGTEQKFSVTRTVTPRTQLARTAHQPTRSGDSCHDTRARPPREHSRPARRLPSPRLRPSRVSGIYRARPGRKSRSNPCSMSQTIPRT